jgi:DNA-binding PucR family transcriptional regulator
MNHLRPGVSELYGDLLQTPRYHRQAEAALEIGAGTVCNYTDVRYGRMLRHLRAHPYREDLAHPAMARLAAMDQAEGTEYIATLRTLIQHIFNQMETADALGIHRTTLAYRLRRIQELTALDLNDARQVFHVAVSLKLIEE